MAAMHKGLSIGLALVLAGLVLRGAIAEQPQRAGGAKPATSIEVYFSPNGGATDAIVRQIGQAERSVRVLAYSFTSAPIAGALRDAHRRGVDVVAVLDKSQRTERYTSATFLHNAGVPVFIDASHAIQHNKVIVIDGQTVVTGSMNFSKAGEERNAENVLIIRDAELAGKYLGNWQTHRDHAELYERRE